jgi:hypothetical protein
MVVQTRSATQLSLFPKIDPNSSLSTSDLGFASTTSCTVSPHQSLTHEPILPPPPSPQAWLWTCHSCNRSYPLGATRRCLYCSHKICYSVNQASRGKRKRCGGPCSSSFDYEGWIVWDMWRRSILSRANETLPSSRSEKVKCQQEAAKAGERVVVLRTHSCFFDCTYPSACAHERAAAKIEGTAALFRMSAAVEEPAVGASQLALTYLQETEERTSWYNDGEDFASTASPLDLDLSNSDDESDANHDSGDFPPIAPEAEVEEQLQRKSRIKVAQLTGLGLEFHLSSEKTTNASGDASLRDDATAVASWNTHRRSRRMRRKCLSAVLGRPDVEGEVGDWEDWDEESVSDDEELMDVESEAAVWAEQAGTRRQSVEEQLKELLKVGSMFMKGEL